MLDNSFYAVEQRKQAEKDKNYLPKVKVLVRTIEDSVEIVLEDNGGGMQIPFNKAFSPSVSTKPKGEGTGLGLSIVEKLCAKSNIRLAASTEPGESTKFTLSVPLSSQSEDLN